MSNSVQLDVIDYEHANNIINETLCRLVRKPNEAMTIDELKTSIILDYLTNESNLITCPKAGSDIWLKRLMPYPIESEVFTCSNGNKFTYNYALQIVTKVVIK